MFGEGHSPNASKICGELGERWEIERIITKTYAAMGGVHAPLDAIFEIGSKRNLAAEQIDHVDVDLPEAAYRHGGWRPQRPLTPVGAQMNVSYAVAVAILDGAAMVSQFSPRRVAAADVWTLIPKITVRHEAAFDDLGPSAQGHARVTVYFTDGTQLDSFIPASTAITEPLSENRVVTKFRTLTQNIVQPERQEAIIRAVLGIDAMHSISELTALLAPSVGAAFD